MIHKVQKLAAAAMAIVSGMSQSRSHFKGSKKSGGAMTFILMTKPTDEDKEEIGERLSDVKASLEEMVDYLKSKGYLKASGYLHRAGEKLFTYVELWLGSGIQVGKTTNIMERTMREVARRVKRIGASWGDLGLLAILKFRLKRYFDKEGYQRQWDRYYNPGACQTTLIVSQAVKSQRYP